MLRNSISQEEYVKISCYETAKEMWDKQQVISEEIEKVKQILINLLVYEHELFKMKERESIEETLQNYY